jgi:hypothetical protein
MKTKKTLKIQNTEEFEIVGGAKAPRSIHPIDFGSNQTYFKPIKSPYNDDIIDDKMTESVKHAVIDDPLTVEFVFEELDVKDQEINIQSMKVILDDDKFINVKP